MKKVILIIALPLLLVLTNCELLDEDLIPKEQEEENVEEPDNDLEEKEGIPTNAFLAKYYSGMDFDTLVTQFIEEEININVDGSPIDNFNEDYFSVKWSGYFDFEESNYKFKLRIDDGMKIWIDEKVVFESWKHQVATDYEFNIELNGKHLIEIHYYEYYGPSVAQVSWSKTVENTNPTNNNSRVGTSFTAHELEIWRKRASDPAFSKEWNRILASANKAVSGDYDRYDNYYKGGKWPDFNSAGSDSYAYEPRPESKSSVSIMNSAFVYLVTGEEKYKTVVESELLRYSKIKELDYSNETVFPLFASLNPGFFIAEWMTKLLTAYDYIGIENKEIEDWFKRFADYSVRNLHRSYNGHIPNRLNDDYTVVNNGWTDKKLGSLWDGGPSVYGFHELFNNRVIAYARYVTLHGLKFNNQNEMAVVKRHFKEYIAYGTYKDDCTWMEHYRGGSTDPEAGIRYGGISLYSLSYIADLFARHGDFSLFEFEIGDAEYQKYYGKNTDKPYVSLVAQKGKSLKKAIDNYLRFYDGTITRYKGGELVDGITNTSWNQNYMLDNLMVQCNLYYQDQNWKQIYMRTKAGTTPMNDYGHVGSWKQWSGLMGTLPGHLFMWQDLEGTLWPYVSSNPI